MTARRTCSMAAGLFLLATATAYAQSEGCTALMQAGADVDGGQNPRKSGA